MRRRALILPFSAVVIAGLCAYKLTRSDKPTDADGSVVINRPAPQFELYNHRKPPQIIRLASFLGRHRIVLVFFDPENGIQNNEILAWLRRHSESLRSKNVQVFAISTVLPQTHRKMLDEMLNENEPTPFLMLSDLDGKVHQRYGRVDETQRKLSGVFLIDRVGNLPWNQNHPLPLEEPLLELAQEFSIE